MNIRTKNVSTLTVLLAFGLGLGGTSVHASSQVGLALYNAAGDGDVDTVRSVLATEVGKSQINRKWQCNRVNPLLEAARKGHDAVVRVLLEHGADVHVSNSSQETPLHSAAFKGHKAIESLLLEHGADTEDKDVDGNTPLCQATNKRHREVAHLLVMRGANTDTLGYQNRELEELERERLEAIRVWAGHLQQNCGLPKVIVDQIIFPMALTGNQRSRFEALARTFDRTDNPRPRKRARGL